MNLHKMIEICLKDDNMYICVMINALICINNYVITCINSMLSVPEADVARKTRTDATRHARPRGIACKAHVALAGGAGGTDTWQEATRVHADARVGRHVAGGLVCDGPTG